MAVCIGSATTIGVDAHEVHVEVDSSFGLVQFYIVGLPDTAIKESSKRILTALKNCGIRLPAKRITVNLAPADLKKEGTLFDLPIALGILAASDFLELNRTVLQTTLILGELSLDGSIRPVKGVLAIASDAARLGKTRMIVPKANAQEAAMIPGIEIIGVAHLTELIAHVRNEVPITPTVSSYDYCAATVANTVLDFKDVKGQQQAKRALQVAAAGRHNILFIGPPGSGKTMLAQRLASIMPAMTFDEIIQTSKIYSITGKLLAQPLITQRPFRNPHHTISQAGLIGGGSYPQPGEISLAHNGILFLDELTEFKRETLESLRQPLESGIAAIARVHQSVEFPAACIWVAALNPCPCGFFGDKKRDCVCSQESIRRYTSKVSGPLLDRIDVQVHVQSVEYDTIKSTEQPMSSEQLFQAVSTACDMQQKRFGSTSRFNGAMSAQQVQQFCVLSIDAETILKKAFDVLGLSMRGYHKILKVARTIADLASSDIIESQHIKEAIMYRSLDRHAQTHGRS